MDAGKELDALVAEKVMGLRLTMSSADHPSIREGVVLPVKLLRYSTDIAAAWLVIEKLRGDFELDLADHILFWTARFTKTGAGMHPVIEAPTAPHAICLAALKAMGVSF